MWRCPNCGEKLDDVFDACWSCGTGKDQAAAAERHAVPGDPGASGKHPMSEPGNGISEHSDSVAARADSTRIVQLCSAANAVEAHAICILLEEAGIRSRVVGDPLGNAAGWLPLGETIAPRIWVREEDAARAREVIDERERYPWRGTGSPAGPDEQTAPESAPEDEGAPGAFSLRSWAGRALTIAGLACIASGAVWAWDAWTVVHRYSGTAEGVLVHWLPRLSFSSPRPSELPFWRDRGTLSVWYEVQYEFIVHGKAYLSVDHHCTDLAYRVPIRYDPRDPAANIAGSLTPPWLVLVLVAGPGGVFAFIGYCLAAKGP